VSGSGNAGTFTSMPTIRMVEDEDVECTITNRETSPSLKVTKVVENNHSGNAAVVDFVLTVGGVVNKCRSIYLIANH